MSLKEPLEDKKFFLKQSGDAVTLKISHPYFYQLQAQMFCANFIRTDLVVWFGNNEPLFIESIFLMKTSGIANLYLGWIIFIVELPSQNFLLEEFNLE